MRVAIVVTAVVTGLLGAATADASTVTRTGSEITFAAAPGEVNLVAVVSRPDIFVTDRANQAYEGQGSPPPQTPAGAGCQAVGGFRGATCGDPPITVVRAGLGDGNDKIGSPPAGAAAEYHGEAGKDVLYGSSRADGLDGGSGNDILKGFGGGDTLIPGPGRDIVQARGGNDTIHAAGDGAVDIVSCGRGRDKVFADKRDRVHGCERVIRK